MGESEFPQEFTDTTHALVGLALVQVEDGYADYFGAVHAAKLQFFLQRGVVREVWGVAVEV